MEILILLILIFLNAFFSLSEIAIVSSNKTRLEQMMKAGNTGAKKTLELRNNADIFLSASQVGMTLVSLITGAFGGMVFSEQFEPYFASIELLAPYSSQISVVLTMVIVSYITVLFGKLFPKTLAITNPEKIASIVSYPFQVIIKLFYPIVKVLSLSNQLLTKTIGLKKSNDSMTEEEIRILLKAVSSEGFLEEELTDIQENVFHFYDKRAKHLMTHRIVVEWIDLNLPEIEIRKKIESSQHSKLVCARGSLDELEGVLNVRDYYKVQLSKKEFRVTDIVVKPIIIHENTTAPNVLKQMRESQLHLSIVVDEYGDFEGIITFHDILESLLGLIPGEGEIEKPEYIIDETGAYIINGDAPVEMLTDIIEDFQLDFEEIDYSTVGGFIIEQMHEIPKKDNQLEIDGFLFTIMQMDGNRIDKVKIEAVTQKEEDIE